jgi:hypothetical protein
MKQKQPSENAARKSVKGHLAGSLNKFRSKSCGLIKSLDKLVGFRERSLMIAIMKSFQR